MARLGTECQGVAGGTTVAHVASMKPLPHQYEVDLTGGPSGCGLTSTVNVPALCVAHPLEFDGPGDRWTPEHLLLASVEACLLLTFQARAKHANLPVDLPADLNAVRNAIDERIAGLGR